MISGVAVGYGLASGNWWVTGGGLAFAAVNMTGVLDYQLPFASSYASV